MLRTNVSSQVHAGGVEPAEEWLVGLHLPSHVVDRRGRRLVVNLLHAFLGQRAGVLDRLLTDLAEAWIDRGIVPIGRLAPQDAARTELGTVGWVLGIVW